jgi:hypothetical protein
VTSKKASPKKNRTGHPSVASRLLLIALALWALAMIVPGFQRVFDSIGSFGLSVNNSGVINDVSGSFETAAESPAALAGIVPGDRLDLKAMRCMPVSTPQCASLVSILGGLAGVPGSLTGHRITLRILPKSGGPPKDVELEAVSVSLGPFERAVVFADTIAGIIVICIGFWLVWTRPGWMTWGLFLYVIWINPGQVVTYYALIQRWPLAVLVQELAESLAQGAAFAGLLIFSLRLPDDCIEPRWQKLQRMVPLIGAAITVLNLFAFSNMFGFHSERVTEISFLAGYAVDAVALLVLLERRRRLPPLEAQRIRWVIWGCAIGLPTFILAELCQSSDLISHFVGAPAPQAVIGLLYLPSGVLTYLASQAVWQRRVVSVSVPLRRGTILAALSLAVGIPISQLHEEFSGVQEHLRLPTWILALVIAPLFLYLLHRVHEFFVEVADRLFNRQFHIAREQMKKAGKAIEHAQALAEIDRLLVETAVHSLSLSSGAVFREQNSAFRRTHDEKGWNDSMKKELRPESDAVALLCLEIGEPLRLGHDDWISPEIPSGLQAPCLSVPVESEIPEATAVALFGPHESGNDLDEDEIELLQKLAARAASSYERVVTHLLRKQVAELRSQLIAMQSANQTEDTSS